tara:strand:+ start:127 stop:819 length:693 start_codon:yes stop_codon:yes gene_type:complete
MDGNLTDKDVGASRVHGLSALAQTTAALLGGLVLAGCSVSSQVEILEARLRDTSDQLVTRTEALRQAEYERDALRIQRDGLLDTQADPPTSPEQADAQIRIARVQIDTWLTGGRNIDDKPGDDELVVLVKPQDREGEPVKLPGTLQLRLTDPSADEGKRVLGTWTYSAAQSKQLWVGGMFSRGFLLTLPWKTTPTRSRLHLHVRYDTTDGRRFDDDLLLTIRPPRSRRKL